MTVASRPAVPDPVAGLSDWVRDRLGGRTPGHGVLKVLRAMSSHLREMSYASTAEAATLAGVNVATVVRAAQLLGYAGWPALRAEARSRYLRSLSASEVLDEHAATSRSPTWAAVRRDVRNLQELAEVLDTAQLARVARHVHEARTTLVLGSGSFAAPGLQLAHVAATVGHDVRLHREGGTALLNAAALLRPGDCLVLFRLWRSPREVMDAARVARGNGATVVVVSDQATQDAVEVADELVLVPSEGASLFPSVTAAVTVAHAVLANLVAMDEDRARAASDRAEGLWATYGLVPPPDQER